MRKRVASIILAVAVSMVLGSACCFGAEVASPSVQWRGFTVDGSIWGSGGSTGFETGEEGEAVVSKLEFPMNGVLAELRGSYAFPIAKQRISVRGRYARSLVAEGTSKDTDYYPDGNIWNYSESDSEADVQQWDFDLVYLHTFKKRISVGAFIGYGSEEADYSDSNLVNLRPDYYTVDGDNATYDVTFTSPRVGLIVRWQIIQRLSVEGEVAGLPLVKAEADALWMLRNYPFHQEAEGFGVTGRLRAFYQFTGHFGMFAGFRGTYLDASSDGTMSGTLDGYSYSDEPILREITSSYGGFEVGVRGLF